MKYILSVCLIITTTVFTHAQVDPYSESVKECLKNNGTYSYYEGVVDQMFTMLKEQYKKQNVPEAVWTELLNSKPDVLNELGQMIVSAYRAHFSHDDVKNMNALYSTQAGKNMIANPKALTEKDNAVLNEFYTSETGQKILASQDSINKLMLEITEVWSGDLYKSMIAKLSDKGYYLEQ